MISRLVNSFGLSIGALYVFSSFILSSFNVFFFLLGILLLYTHADTLNLRLRLENISSRLEALREQY